MARNLVVFDFDWSFVEQDTDRYVFEVLKPEYRSNMRSLKDSVQWTDLVAQHLAKLHQDGFAINDIASALHSLPLHPATKRATAAYKTNKDATFICLSNSNTFFINTILEHHSISDFFQDIITNPASAQSDGLLKLERRVKPTDKQHECRIGCSPNMCKGDELEAWLNQQGGIAKFDRIIYVGDGSNDYCPLLRLRPQDIVFCRKHRGLEGRIAKEGQPPCQVQKWAGPYEMELLFLAAGK